MKNANLFASYASGCRTLNTRPIFSPPEVGAVIVPLIDQMVRQAQDEAQEAAAYARLEQEEEDQALARWFEMQEN